MTSAIENGATFSVDIFEAFACLVAEWNSHKRAYAIQVRSLRALFRIALTDEAGPLPRKACGLSIWLLHGAPTRIRAFTRV